MRNEALPVTAGGQKRQIGKLLIQSGDLRERQLRSMRGKNQRHSKQDIQPNKDIPTNVLNVPDKNDKITLENKEIAGGILKVPNKSTNVVQAKKKTPTNFSKMQAKNKKISSIQQSETNKKESIPVANIANKK